jgi:hypothetical protein
MKESTVADRILWVDSFRRRPANIGVMVGGDGRWRWGEAGKGPKEICNHH